ncbi:MAG: peptidase S10 [Candidatus Heimdallarchaeota archaeon]|nr:peptidase S10 [Candidatus Heimdallarchaeota archaeon]
MTEGNENSKDKKEESKKKEPKELLSETQHSVTINGKEINYTARAGTMVLKYESEEKGPEAKAEIFFMSYTKNDEADLHKRPMMFSFNGGPGSSSVWLHLGMIGPRRVQVEDNDENLLSPPYKLIDNDFSILDQADLCFIDPVGTGYSRSVEGEKPDQFYEVKADVEAIGEFIRLYTTRYNRWTSPKFLIGESYGTTRAAGLAGHLQERHGLDLNGIILVSSILDFTNIGTDIRPRLLLPTLTATSWYHKMLDDDLQQDLEKTIEMVRSFCDTELILAYNKGDSLVGEERADIISKLKRFTGLSEEYLESVNLRLSVGPFNKELLRSKKRTVGRLDGRYLGIDKNAGGGEFSHDPSMTAIRGPYTATFNDYVRRELEFETDLLYEILGGLYTKWSFKPQFYAEGLNVAETLRDAISKNNALKVHVMNGYYDMATPFHVTEYTFNHLGIDPILQENITMSYYEAGHMMYIKESCMTKVREEMVKFLENAL